MSQLRTLVLLVTGMCSLTGCGAPTLPPATALAQGMAEVLVDTGFYKEVGITDTLGHHYTPSTDVWTVFACYRFTTMNDTQGSNCVDSFSALRLDNGSWVVSVTIEDVYRWRAINFVTPIEGSAEAGDPQTGTP